LRASFEPRDNLPQRASFRADYFQAAATLTITTDSSEQYFAPPQIAEARAIDPLNNDTALGENDMLRITFDRETSGLYNSKYLTNRTYVDELLSFEDAAGPVELPADAHYEAEWTDTSTLLISFGVGTDNATEPTRVAVRESANLRTRAGLSEPSSSRAGRWSSSS